MAHCVHDGTSAPIAAHGHGVTDSTNGGSDAVDSRTVVVGAVVARDCW